MYIKTISCSKKNPKNINAMQITCDKLYLFFIRHQSRHHIFYCTFAQNSTNHPIALPFRIHIF